MMIKKYLRILLTYIQRLTEKILLTFLYFVGIGITSIIAKLVRKKFLKLQVKNSAWEKPSGNKNLETMY